MTNPSVQMFFTGSPQIPPTRTLANQTITMSPSSLAGLRVAHVGADLRFALSSVSEGDRDEVLAPRLRTTPGPFGGVQGF